MLVVINCIPTRKRIRSMDAAETQVLLVASSECRKAVPDLKFSRKPRPVRRPYPNSEADTCEVLFFIRLIFSIFLETSPLSKFMAATLPFSYLGLFREDIMQYTIAYVANRRYGRTHSLMLHAHSSIM